MKPYIGLDMTARTIKWVRLGIDTTLEDTMAAQPAEAMEKTWQAFLDNMNEDSPEALGPARMSTFLWVRITTELSLIRSTITAWAISNVSAFIVILLFTRSL
jgi:hypothetical protein